MEVEVSAKSGTSFFFAGARCGAGGTKDYAVCDNACVGSKLWIWGLGFYCWRYC